MTERLSTETGFDEIKENYLSIMKRIERAKEKAGRSDEVRLMAVTKTIPEDKINYAISLGIDLVGENKVQELLSKEYSMAAELHLIGSLQTNKVKYIVEKVSCIESVDSLRLASEISKRSAKIGKTMDILIEINIGGEESKSGIAPKALDDFMEKALELPNIRLRGLMCVPPIGCGDEIFSEMQKIYIDKRDKKGDNIKEYNYKWDTLSMGMTQDFETAILYGSNIVRIGSALFGYRNYNNGGN